MTVTEPDGRRHRIDVPAVSTFDAAHLFVVEVKKERSVELPTLATGFEVVANARNAQPTKISTGFHRFASP